MSIIRPTPNSWSRYIWVPPGDFIRICQKCRNTGIKIVHHVIMMYISPVTIAARKGIIAELCVVQLSCQRRYYNVSEITLQLYFSLHGQFHDGIDDVVIIILQRFNSGAS